MCVQSAEAYEDKSGQACPDLRLQRTSAMHDQGFSLSTEEHPPTSGQIYLGVLMLCTIGGHCWMDVVDGLLHLKVECHGYQVNRHGMFMCLPSEPFGPAKSAAGCTLCSTQGQLTCRRRIS